jgi:hypothetical protein
LRKNVLHATALATVVALVAAGPAMAKPAGKPKAATFTLTVKGEQLTEWDFVKDQAPSCDWPETAGGRQYISFGTYQYGDTAKPKVKVKPKKGGGVELDFARDDAYFLQAEADMLRSYRVLYSQMSECEPGQGPFGGGDPPQDEIGTAKCRTTGEVEMWTGASIGEVESPYYPTDVPNDPDDGKDRFYFAGDPSWTLSDSFHSLPARCGEEGQYNADIGITESQGEWAGAIIPAGTEFSAKKLLGSKKKVTKIEVGRTVKYPNEVQTWGGPEHTTGTTRMDATFTFKRLGKGSKGKGKKG